MRTTVRGGPLPYGRGSVWAVALCAAAGCSAIEGLPRPDESTEAIDAERFALLARLVHITDPQIVDEESPARLTFAARFTHSAWRPHEAYATQLLDGTVRAINKLHVSGTPIDFVIVTGDAVDNAQANELRWFISVMDGGPIDPRTGPDDREPADRPERLLDPHEPFQAQGLYRNGVHGNAATIPWYTLFGNHDRFAVGVLPIVTDPTGKRVAPVPPDERIGLLFPPVLDPTDFLSWALITPADPGPPGLLNVPVFMAPNPQRRYITDDEFIGAHLASSSDPPGHGFDPQRPGRTWYSVSPVSGLRLIGLNSAKPPIEVAGFVYPDGAVTRRQVRFLRRELQAACGRDEVVIVATHHPSDRLLRINGTALSPDALRATLNEFSCVALHLAGHIHRNRVIDYGGYLEVTTSAVIDPPQQGRIIELWHSLPPSQGGTQGGPTAIQIRYRLFSHLDEISLPDDEHAALFDDPLLPMRRIAADLANAVPH